MTDKQDIYKRIQKGNRVLEIIYDRNAENPRETYDHLGTMVMWHKRYDYNDGKAPSCTPGEFIAELPEHVKLPLYMIDHSGIGFSTGDYNDKWDSEQVGFIYVTHEDIKNEYGVLNDETTVKAKTVLESEIKELDMYVRGDVYGYRVYTLETCKECGHTEEVDEEEDSCWGLIATNPEKYVWENLCKTDQELFKELSE